MWNWIINNAAAGALAAAVSTLFPIYQYMATKRSEDHKNTFATYHKLIEELVDSKSPKVDRQIATIFELRNFTAYYPVSLRILEGLKVDWWDKNKRVLKEIELTIDYLKQKI